MTFRERVYFFLVGVGLLLGYVIPGGGVFFFFFFGGEAIKYLCVWWVWHNSLTTRKILGRSWVGLNLPFLLD